MPEQDSVPHDGEDFENEVTMPTLAGNGGAQFLDERAVKQCAEEFLGQRFTLVIKEFPFPDGRLDFVAAKWRNESELDVVGVECKGTIDPSEIRRIASGQLARYLKAFPAIYFACSPQREGREPTYADQCKRGGIGLLLVRERELFEVFPPPRPGDRFDEVDYLTQTRSRLVMRLAFGEVFGESIKSDPGVNWCSTPEETRQPQRQAHVRDGRIDAVFERDERICAAFNLENAGRWLENVEATTLAHHLQQLDGWSLDARLEHYYAPYRRESEPIVVGKPALNVTVADIADLRNRSGAMKGFTVHLGVWAPLWHVKEVLSRHEYVGRMRRAYDQLKPLFALSSGRAR